MALPVRIDIVRVKGDTYPFTLTLGQAITGCTFELVVADGYTMAGTVTNGAGGVVQFAPTSEQANSLSQGTRSYRVLMTQNSTIRTVCWGSYDIREAP